ncbi:MAG: calcium/sodium antiporter [Planctomycetota bacterium]|jgi:cation:H+ antiporter
MVTQALNWLQQHPWSYLLVLPLGFVLLLRSADWLVDGAVELARRIGISTLVIGLTIVAFGTSAPELAVNLAAGLSGHPELSFGNVIGSNIANIGLVIGIGALIAPIDVHGRVVRLELPLLIIVSMIVILLAYLPVTAITGPDGALVRGYSRVDGALMLAGFLGFCVLWFKLGKKDTSDPLAKEASQKAREESRQSVGSSVAMVIAGLIGLVVAGKMTEISAVGMARWLGFGEAVIGMTVVALATSLPELAVVVSAARRGQTDLAVGNVVGSNVFNLLLVLAITAIAAEVPLPDQGGLYDLIVMNVLTVLLLLVAARYSKVHRFEGVFLVLLYVAYMAYRVISEVVR